MPIGSIWNVVSGPMGSGVAIRNVISSSSYSDLEIVIDKSLKSNLELGILNYLKLGGEYNTNANITVSIKKLERFTLHSLDILKANIGNQVLFEGIKVAKISILVSKEKLADIRSELFKIFNNAKH